jgi:anti-sigma factor RsiW
MSDAQDILGLGADQPNKKGLTEAQMQAYLEGTLSPDEQHEVEVFLSEEGMEADALEGLKQLDPEETKIAVSSLNNNLRKQVLGRRAKRKKLITENKWAWIAIVTVLVLVVLAYIVVKMSVKP